MLIVERRLENENQFVLFPRGLYGKAAISSLSASRLLFNVKRIEKATTNFNDCPSPPLLRSAKAFPTRLIINRVRFSLSIVPFQARNPYRIRGTTVSNDRLFSLTFAHRVQYSIQIPFSRREFERRQQGLRDDNQIGRTQVRAFRFEGRAQLEDKLHRPFRRQRTGNRAHIVVQLRTQVYV